MDNQQPVIQNRPDITFNHPGVAFNDVKTDVQMVPLVQSAESTNVQPATAPAPQEQVPPPVNKPDAPGVTPLPGHECNFRFNDSKFPGYMFCPCGERRAKLATGRPSKLTPEVMEKAKKYVESCANMQEGKVRVPYIEELALLLKVNEDQLVNWSKENEEFGEIYTTLKTIQKWRLKQKTFGGKNALGSMFLLKTLYGLVETDKRILAGSNQPGEILQIEIIEDGKPLDQNTSQTIQSVVESANEQ